MRDIENYMKGKGAEELTKLLFEDLDFIVYRAGAEYKNEAEINFRRKNKLPLKDINDSRRFQPDFFVQWTNRQTGKEEQSYVEVKSSRYGNCEYKKLLKYEVGVLFAFLSPLGIWMASYDQVRQESLKTKAGKIMFSVFTPIEDFEKFDFSEEERRKIKFRKKDLCHIATFKEAREKYEEYKEEKLNGDSKKKTLSDNAKSSVTVINGSRTFSLGDAKTIKKQYEKLIEVLKEADAITEIASQYKCHEADVTNLLLKTGVEFGRKRIASVTPIVDKKVPKKTRPPLPSARAGRSRAPYNYKDLNKNNTGED